MSQRNKAILGPGTMVAGRYRIEGTVGRGGFGAVYDATQLSSGQRVALKVLLKNFSTSETDAKRFQREAAMVQQLKHPNVVEIFDFGYTHQQQPYIAFELLHGESLGDAIKQRGALNFKRACRVTRDVLGALGAAHSMGIIHRDIKPQNIFLCDDGSSKVLDFGIAKAVRGKATQATQLTETGQMLGTPQYMAPEQVRGADIVPATDLYALGLVIGEMLSGERVVSGGALIDVYMAHISDDPFELHPSIANSALGEVVRRAVTKSLSQRYTSALHMLADVDSALRGGDAATRKPASTYKMAEVHNPSPAAPHAPAAAPAPAPGSVDEPFDPLNATILMPEGLDESDALDSLAATAYIPPDDPLSMSTVVMTPERHAEHMATLQAHTTALADAPDSSDIDGTLEMNPVADPSIPAPAWPAPPAAATSPSAAPAALPAAPISLTNAMHEGTGSTPIPPQVLRHMSSPSAADAAPPAQPLKPHAKANPRLFTWLLLALVLTAVLAAVAWLVPWR